MSTAAGEATLERRYFWSPDAAGCPADDLPPGGSRLYVGLDGLFVATVTDAEKRKRRRSHAARRAARTRRGLANDPLPPRRPGTDQRFKEAKARGPDALLAGIDALGRSVRRSGPKREAVRLLRAYVANHREMRDYPTLIAAGWDVGSGPTDALCKALTTRLRGPGMKWDLDHAAAMMDLKAMYASGQAAAYWSSAA